MLATMAYMECLGIALTPALYEAITLSYHAQQTSQETCLVAYQAQAYPLKDTETPRQAAASKSKSHLHDRRVYPAPEGHSKPHPIWDTKKGQEQVSTIISNVAGFVQGTGNISSLQTFQPAMYMDTDLALLQTFKEIVAPQLVPKKVFLTE